MLHTVRYVHIKNMFTSLVKKKKNSCVEMKKGTAIRPVPSMFGCWEHNEIRYWSLLGYQGNHTNAWELC